MKKFIYSFCLLSLISLTANAQTFQFWHNGPAVYNHDTCSNPFAIVAYFKNNAATTQRFKFFRAVKNFPGATWSNSICTSYNCYPPNLDTIPPYSDQPLSLAPGQTDSLTLDFSGLSIGLGTVVLKCWAISNPAVFLTDTIKVQLNYHTGIRKIESVVDNYNLMQNYPNPFNPTTNIEFSIPKREYVTLKVYNLLGSEIATLVNESLESGKYKFDFKSGDYNLSSGFYYYRLQTDNFIQTRKMILAK